MRNSYWLTQATLKVLLAAGSVSIAGGCGKKSSPPIHDVHGVVTYKNVPVSYGHVTLYPTQGPPLPAAILSKDGSFSTKVAAGRYKVVVEAIPPPDGARPEPRAEGGFDYSHATPAKSLVPLKYSRPETTDVEIEVSDSSENQVSISLR